MTEKETIVLIHGAFTNCADWKQIASDLDQSFHVLTPDLPGHGDAAETRFTMGKAADTIHTLIQSSATGGKAIACFLRYVLRIRLQSKYRF
ncbi:alpha/beta-hydrolase [Penicillium canescens]|nr:alpha/beta-hydrolase [Penicillium canescens]KAJ6068520.1 alpha/beta-hydrolase [Penicillium canescens]KAJ6183427.1 alpha/beta-hydrolase [Penicillium canescens]